MFNKYSWNNDLDGLKFLKGFTTIIQLERVLFCTNASPTSLAKPNAIIILKKCS